MQLTKWLALVIVLGALGARAQDPASEIRLLRQQLEQQAAELERLRAAIQRIENIATAPPPQQKPVSAPPSATAPVKFNGLLQAWATTGDAGFQDTFRIRRAELKFSGNVAQNVGWAVMVDAAKALSTTTANGQTAINQSGRTLQDAFLTIGAPSRVQLTAGQFKIPISREGLESSAALATVERALFMTDRTRGGAYGDVRDIGLALRRTVPDRYDIFVGVFNGTGESQNDVDRNERKSVVARAVAPVPAIQGLQLGASAAWGGGRGGERRERRGADVLFTRGRWTLKSEFMAGRDGAVERLGLYGHVGARVSPRVDLVGRFDQWDPDTSSDHDLATSQERDYLFGGSILVVPSLRLQANFIHKTYAADAVPARNLLLINLQTSW
jgi:hypothetical protein